MIENDVYYNAHIVAHTLLYVENIVSFICKFYIFTKQKSIFPNSRDAFACPATVVVGKRKIYRVDNKISMRRCRFHKQIKILTRIFVCIADVYVNIKIINCIGNVSNKLHNAILVPACVGNLLALMVNTAVGARCKQNNQA